LEKKTPAAEARSKEERERLKSLEMKVQVIVLSLDHKLSNNFCRNPLLIWILSN
jgi:hypothetical protein